ncbi:MAG: cation acetate symporter, partial [Pseudonocardiaceae bacterium]|nr:cation acetate symporter [Pseudonocardiaceae bacterium]
LVYTLFWRRFNTSGTLWGMYGGLISCVGLIIFSPAVSGSDTAMFPGFDISYFPLENPGIVSVPLSFLLGYLGTVLSKEESDDAKYAEMEVRSLTGAGAEKAVTH